MTLLGAEQTTSLLVVMIVLFLGLRSPPGIVACNVIDDLDGAHAPVTELDMGLGVIAGGEVDFGGAFVVESLFRDMIVKTPVS